MSVEVARVIIELWARPGHAPYWVVACTCGARMFAATDADAVTLHRAHVDGHVAEVPAQQQ